MYPTSLLLLLYVCFTCIADIRPGVQAQAACQPERCGNLTVSSPFGIISGSEENSCAQLGFQVHCVDSVPYLGYYEAGFGLQILNIFYSNSFLLVSDVHKLRDFNLSGETGCWLLNARSNHPEQTHIHVKLACKQAPASLRTSDTGGDPSHRRQIGRAHV